jgi:hypothetical protein
MIFCCGFSIGLIKNLIKRPHTKTAFEAKNKSKISEPETTKT